METPPSARTEVKRLAERGVYDRATIHAILDEALICHIGFVHDDYPVVVPTIHARVDNTLYIHGSPASRMLRDLKAGSQICVTVSIVDGLVIARAPFHSSMNYRSVMVFGTPRAVVDPAEKWEAFRAVTEHVSAGRWDDSRLPNEREMRSTAIIALPIDEASAKVRTGPPVDDEEDYGLPIWAGVIPLELVAREPVPDPRLSGDLPVPPYLAPYTRS